MLVRRQSEFTQPQAWLGNSITDELNDRREVNFTRIYYVEQTLFFFFVFNFPRT
ncbi:hypothetical protein PGB90_005787 [Kerria lacca]